MADQPVTHIDLESTLLDAIVSSTSLATFRTNLASGLVQGYQNLHFNLALYQQTIDQPEVVQPTLDDIAAKITKLQSYLT